MSPTSTMSISRKVHDASGIKIEETDGIARLKRVVSSIATQMQNLTTSVNSFIATTQSSSTANTAAPSTTQGTQPKRQVCAFCGDASHFFKECSGVTDYLEKKK